MRRTLLALGLSLLAAACSESGSRTDRSVSELGTTDGPAPPIPNLTGLEVTPATKTLTLDNGATGTVPYTATGTFADGSKSDVTSKVAWSADNLEPGSIASGGATPGLYSANGKAGGKVVITAAATGKDNQPVSGKANLTVVVDRTIVGTGVPANAASLFDPGKTRDSSTTAKRPVEVYPNDKTLFPRNIFKILFQWKKGTGNTLFHLTFKSDAGNVQVYTKGDACPKADNTTLNGCLQVAADAACWEPTSEHWDWIAGSNAGGSVKWEVEALDEASPATIYTGTAAETLYFSKSKVEGAIFYWSTTVQGIRRATVSTAKPQNFLTPSTPYPTQQLGTCVACHTVSRNGARLAANFGKGAGLVDVKTKYPPVVDWNTSSNAPVSWPKNTWATFNPDASLIVSSHDGVLTLRDGNTGVPKTTLKIPSPNPYGTMPDWSPDGSMLVFARSNTAKDRGIVAASLSIMPYTGGAFGAAKDIVPGSATVDNYYPMFAPGSEWLAFVRSPKTSEKDPAAELYLVDKNGAKTPLALTQTNTIVNNQSVATGVHNNMPTWAPSSESGIAWVAFSSSRIYGLVSLGGNLTAPGDHNRQIWVAAVDLSKAGTGADPSYPAFRLPFQDHCENVHRPFWAVDVTAPPPPVDAGPPPADVGCIPLGGNCAGSISPCCVGLNCSEAGDAGYTCQTVK